MKWIAAAHKHLIATDPEFAILISKSRSVPFTVPSRVDLFSALSHAIVNQQLSGRAAETIFRRFRSLFPRKRLTPTGMRTLSFHVLRRSGLSRNKIHSLRDLARHLESKRLPSANDLKRLTDEEIIVALTRVRGIGTWTAQMLLIFKLGRPNVFPSADLGIQKGFRRLFGHSKLPTAKQLDQHSLRWHPYKTLAAWYLWRAADESIVDATTKGRMRSVKS